MVSGRPHMREIGSLVEAYLIAEHNLVTAVDAAGGAVPPRSVIKSRRFMCRLPQPEDHAVLLKT